MLDSDLGFEQSKVVHRARQRENLVDHAAAWRQVGIQERIASPGLPTPLRLVVLVVLAALDFYVFALAVAKSEDVRASLSQPAFLLGGLLGLTVFGFGLMLAQLLKGVGYARAQAAFLAEVQRGEISVGSDVDRRHLVPSRISRLLFVVMGPVFLLMVAYSFAIRWQSMGSSDDPNLAILQSLIPVLGFAVELYLHDPTAVRTARPTWRLRRLTRASAHLDDDLEQMQAQSEAERARIDQTYDEAETLLRLELARSGVDPAILAEAELRDRARADAQLTVDALQEGAVTVVDLDRVRDARLKYVRALMEDNACRSVTLSRLTVKGSAFFDDFSYEFSPRINLLLGKNGYGKSQLLRLAVAMAQQHSAVASLALADPEASGLDVGLDIDIDGHLSKSRYHGDAHMRDATGVIPVLAIPEIRTLDRRATYFGAPSGDLPDLVVGGATAFLDGRPYGDIVTQLYYELALDVIEAGGEIGTSSVRLLQDVMNDLTDRQFTFDKVSRRGRTDLQILVCPEGSDYPIPLQQASQGALSVLALFGLIDSYRRAIGGLGHQPDDARSVVVIDEVDAHLHPQWQQVIVPLLRRTFPTMQFLLTCHSPFVVMGARAGEVAVLRKGRRGLTLEQFGRDFIGTQAADVLAEVFRAEGYDQTFVEYSVKALARADYQHRLDRLDALSDPTPAERRERDHLQAELALIDRVTGQANVEAEER